MAQARLDQMPVYQTLYAKAQDRKFCTIRHLWSAQDSTQGGELRRTLTLAHPAAQMCLLIVYVRANSYHVSNTARQSIALAKCDNLEQEADLSRALTITRLPSLRRSALIAHHMLMSTALSSLRSPPDPPISPSGVCRSHIGRRLHHHNSRQEVHRSMRSCKTRI